VNSVTAVLIDDEPALSEHLASVLAELWTNLDVVGTAEDGQTGLTLVEKHQPDVVFLDIKMPGMDGLQVAKTLCERSSIALVVFVTAYDEHAIAAFEHKAIDYLLKPIQEQRLAKTVDNLKSKLQITGQQSAQVPELNADTLATLISQLEQTRKTEIVNWLKLPHLNDIYLVNFDDIIYVKAEDKYTTVVTASQEYTSRKTIRQLSIQLDTARFLQISRAAIINLNYLDKIVRCSPHELYAKLTYADVELKVSRSFASSLRQL